MHYQGSTKSVNNHVDKPINSSCPGAAYMRQWGRTALAQVMACRLLDTKPLPEPMLIYCQLEPSGQLSMKIESQFLHFHSRICVWKCCLRNGSHLVQGRWVNIQSATSANMSHTPLTALQPHSLWLCNNLDDGQKSGQGWSKDWRTKGSGERCFSHFRWADNLKT